MSVFGYYARYYDLLYEDKNYMAEAKYVLSLLENFNCPSTILELGCGTGRHASYMAGLGATVCGIDQSEHMLERAVSLKEGLPENTKKKLDFLCGDIRSIRTGNTYGAVMSLFHVLSYQSTDRDLDAVFATAAMHLERGGVFLFDCWYGPAVLTLRPHIRVKRLEDEAISVTRIAEPVLYPNENLVDVNYSVFIRDRSTGQIEELQETHRMRYLFFPEILVLTGKHGFTLERAEEWMTGKPPGFDTWSVCFVLQKA